MWQMIIAQAAGGGGAGAGGAAGGGGGAAGSGFSFLLTFVLPILVIFYFLMIRPGQRDQRKREQQLAAIKKNDRVVTVGGIYGVVANVHAEIDEITLKVDEATGTKIRVTRGAIARVLQEEKEKSA